MSISFNVCQSADGLNMVMEKYLAISSNKVVQEKRKIMETLKSNSSYIFYHWPNPAAGDRHKLQKKPKMFDHTRKL
jgi:hypothetical protein